MIEPEEFRFVFKVRGVTFGLTQDPELVKRAGEYGLPNRDYEREPGVIEWEVNLGRRDDDASGELPAGSDESGSVRGQLRGLPSAYIG